MPITDANLTLSVAQVVTATAFSTNTIDLGRDTSGQLGAGSQARDIGPGEETSILVRVAAAVTAAGAATVNFQIVTSANANLSSPTIIGQSDAIPKANLGLGALVILPIPVSVISNLGQRY